MFSNIAELGMSGLVCYKRLLGRHFCLWRHRDLVRLIVPFWLTDTIGRPRILQQGAYMFSILIIGNEILSGSVQEGCTTQYPPIPGLFFQDSFLLPGTEAVFA